MDGGQFQSQFKIRQGVTLSEEVHCSNCSGIFCKRFELVIMARVSCTNFGMSQSISRIVFGEGSRASMAFLKRCLLVRMMHASRPSLTLRNDSVIACFQR